MAFGSPIWRNRTRGGAFNPASIAGLRQFLFFRTALSGSIVFDERTNKGGARAVQLGRCYNTDGINDYVNTGVNPTLSGEMECDFITTSSVIGIEVLIGGFSGGNTRCYLGVANNRIAGGIGAMFEFTIFGTTTLVVGTKYTGKITWNGTTVKLFLNGVQEYSGAQSGSVTTTQPMFIGAFNNNGAGPASAIDARIWNAKIKDGSSVDRAFYKCDEQDGTTSYDSSGNGNHGTIFNATLGTFHGTQNVYSWQNEVGYSKPASVFIPRNEAIPTQDVTGAALQFSGSAPNNGLLKQSNCVSCDGTNDYIDFGNTGTVTSYKGWVKLDAINQNIWTLTDNTNTRLHVTGATLTGGASLTLSNIKTNGVTATAAAAGALLNTLAWTYLEVDFTSTSATALRVGSGGAGNFGNADFALIQFYNGVSLVVDASCSEGAGLIAYNGANPALNGTLVNGVAWAKQDVVHQNFTLGFSRYDHATDPDIMVRYSSAGAPLVITPPTGYTKISDNPYVAGAHNGAGTQIDFTGGVASPRAVINSWETAWAFNTARVNPEFDRTTTLGGLDYRMDRALAYDATLSGADLTKVQNFTATRAL